MLSAHLWLAALPCLTAVPLPHQRTQAASSTPRAAVPSLQPPKKLLGGNGAVSHEAEWNHWFGKEAAREDLCLEDLYFKQATANIKGEQIHYQQVISKQLITVSLPTRS